MVPRLWIMSAVVIPMHELPEEDLLVVEGKQNLLFKYFQGLNPSQETKKLNFLGPLSGRVTPDTSRRDLL
jgi:hypothetical protein